MSKSFQVSTMDVISESLVRSVAKKLKHYIDVERREEGFDSSGSLNPLGEFNFGKGLGGTLHYNSLQDKHLDHYFQNPMVRKHLVEMGVVHPGTFEQINKQRKRSKSVGHKPSCLEFKSDQRRLMEYSAKLLLSDPLVQEQSKGNYRKSSNSSFTSSVRSHQSGSVGSTSASDSTSQKQRHSNQPTSRANVPLTDQTMAQYGFLQHPKPTISHHDYNQSRAPTPSHGHSRKSLSWSGLSPNTRSNTSFSTWTENTRGGHTLYNDCPQSVPSPSTIYPSTMYPLPTIVYPPGTNVSVHTPTAGCVSYPGVAVGSNYSSNPPVMMGSVGGSTKSSRDASTQTPVHSETQTDDDITNAVADS